MHGDVVAHGHVCHNPPVDVNDAMIDSWLLSLHDKAPSTRREYQRNVRWFAKWFEGDLLTATRRDLEKYFTSLAHLSQNTRRARWCALRSFYGWAHEEEEIPLNPMERVKVAKSEEPPPDVLKLDEIKALLKACQGTDFYARRDTALVRFFFATGCRLNEVASMEVSDIDLKARIAHIMGKGSKVRAVRFDPGTAAAVDRYMRARARHRCARESALWIGLKGPVRGAGIAAALERRAAQAGVEGFHCHRLRHSWADAWKRAGGQEGDLMLLGGWSDPKIMGRYGQRQAVDRALASYDQVDPLKGL